MQIPFFHIKLCYHSLYLGKNGKNLPFMLLLSGMVIQSSLDISVLKDLKYEIPSAETQYLKFSEDTGILKLHWVSSQSSLFSSIVLFMIYMRKQNTVKKFMAFNLPKKNQSPYLHWPNTQRKHVCDECCTWLKRLFISDKSVCYFTEHDVAIKMFFIGIRNLKTQIGMFY